MSYVYISQTKWGEAQDDGEKVFVVGFYRADRGFEHESDHPNSNAAAERCHYLNGGIPDYELKLITKAAHYYIMSHPT